MKNKLAIIGSILALGIFSSCEKDIEIAVEETEEKMVVNSWLKAGEPPVVELANSVFVFSNRNSASVSNARVSLLEDGEELGSLVYDNETKLYSNQNITIRDFHEYEILVEHSRFGASSARAMMPQKYSMGDLKFEYLSKVQNHNYSGNYSENYSGEIIININDKADEKNYYLIRLVSVFESYSPDYSPDTLKERRDGHYSLEYPEGQGEEIYIPGGSVYIVSDEVFDGNNVALKIYSYNDLRGREEISEYSYSKEYYEVELHQINEALYRYFVSLESNRYPDVFTEPSQVYSNINNGYGILGLSTRHIFTIEEKR